LAGDDEAPPPPPPDKGCSIQVLAAAGASSIMCALYLMRASQQC
jgi:hypothetical protein